MIFREANTKDLPQLLELEQRVIDFERPYNPSLKSNGVNYYDLPHLISSSDSHLIVVEVSGKIIGTGYAQIRDSKNSLEHERHSYIGFMYVSPDHRRKGISQSVMERLIEWSQSKGVSDLYLDVYSQNESATKAYRKAGFKPCLMEMKLCI